MPETLPAELTYPWTTSVGDLEVRFCRMDKGDKERILRFTRGLPERDRLFLRVDITDPQVVDRWVSNIDEGKTATILALSGEEVIGYCSLHHSEILWTRHLGEMRLLVGPDYRGRGLGGMLARQIFQITKELKLQKLIAQMMSTQRDAQALFHHLGFIPEALLQDWVIDRKGRTHDFILMSREVDSEDNLADDRADVPG